MRRDTCLFEQSTRWLTLAGVLCVICLTQPQALAAQLISDFDDPQQAALYHRLLKEYRCLKCQNQNLADSNAGLAGDLRREIREQILAGKTKSDIDDYLVARYGEFVLYRPRFTASTAILWIGPFVLLLVALGSVTLMIKRRAASPRELGMALTDSGLTDIEPGADSSAASLSSTDERMQDRLSKARRLLQD